MIWSRRKSHLFLEVSKETRNENVILIRSKYFILKRVSMRPRLSVQLPFDQTDDRIDQMIGYQSDVCVPQTVERSRPQSQEELTGVLEGVRALEAVVQAADETQRENARTHTHACTHTHTHTTGVAAGHRHSKMDTITLR